MRNKRRQHIWPWLRKSYTSYWSRDTRRDGGECKSIAHWPQLPWYIIPLSQLVLDQCPSIHHGRLTTWSSYDMSMVQDVIEKLRMDGSQNRYELVVKHSRGTLAPLSTHIFNWAIREGFPTTSTFKSLLSFCDLCNFFPKRKKLCANKEAPLKCSKQFL